MTRCANALLTIVVVALFVGCRTKHPPTEPDTGTTEAASRQPKAPGPGKPSDPIVGKPGPVPSSGPGPSVPPVVAPKPDPTPVVRQPRARRVGHYGQVTALASVPGGKTVVSGSRDGTVRVWDLGALKERATFLGGDAMVHRVAVAPNGRTLAASGSSGVRVWDLATRKERRLTGTGKDAYGLALGADGRSVTATSAVQIKDGAVSRLDGRVYTWDLTREGPPAVFNGKPGQPVALAFTAGDERVAVAENGEVTLYDRATGQPVAGFKADARNVAWVTAAPNGSTLAVAGTDKTVRLLDAGTGHTLGTFSGHATAIGQLAFSPDGSLLAGAPADARGTKSAGIEEVRVWEVAGQRTRAVLRGPSGWMTAVAFGPDADTVLTAGRDGVVCVWHLPRAGDPAPGSPTIAGVAPAPVPATAGKLRLQWRPVAGADGTWSAVLPGGAVTKHDVSQSPGGAELVSDTYNVGIAEGGQLVCQVRVDAFARTPTREEFETDNEISLRRLVPQLGLDPKKITATTTTADGQYARRYECKTPKLGQFVSLRVLVTEPKRTRIFSLTSYGADATADVQKAFLDSFRVLEPPAP